MINWFDAETTGIEHETGYLLEVGCIITDDKLNEVGRLATCIRHECDVEVLLAASNDYVREMHTESGLWDDLRRGVGMPMREAEIALGALVETHSGGEKYVLAGNSIHFDRRWLTHNMPDMVGLLHYRNFDVSTLKETYLRFAPEAEPFPKETGRHRVLTDLEYSIDELRYYLAAMGWDGGLS